MVNTDTIKKKLQDFYDKNKRYPKTVEINALGFSARTIQRKFGGIENMYKYFDFEYEYPNKGNVIRDNRTRSLAFEKEVYEWLCSSRDPISVHPQRPFFIDQEMRCSFYLYKEDKWVDAMNTVTTESTKSCLRIKRKKYQTLPQHIKMKMYYITPGQMVLRRMFPSG